MLEAYSAEIAAFTQVIFIDLVLAGDNAVVVGMAAAGVSGDRRRQVIMLGIAGAVVLRIVLALMTTQLMAITGLLFAGGLLLLWVCWKLFVELRAAAAEEAAVHAMADGTQHLGAPLQEKTFAQAMWQIVVADISMSLDNVLAVAGAARDHPYILVFGLALSIVLMGVAATLIAGLLQKHRWIGWVGLLVILYVALQMIWDGSGEVVALV
ncbi:MAG TPA: YjbE family putative metal transport protein [Afifellaceae bacterium]|nr:YjbE family putative metal transport protein [Afifellaceae bacterium]